MLRPTVLRYAELHSYSCFSFLRGASHPEDLVTQARQLGLFALALTDRDAVYAAPRFHTACQEQGVRGVIGSDVTVVSEDGHEHSSVLLVKNLAGWKNLCRLLTRGRRAAAKGQSRVSFATLAEHAQGLVCLSGGRFGAVEAALLAGDEEEAEARADRYASAFGRRNFLLEQHHHLLADENRLRGLQQRLARRVGLRAVASNHAHYATRAGRALQDVLVCIRERTGLDQVGRRLLPNGEFSLKGPEEMARLFREAPEVLRRTVEVADRCRFALDELRYELPEFEVPEGETSFSFLHRLTGEGARRRYRPLTPKVARQLAHELDVIDRLGFAGYFLIVWDIVRFCRAQDILCQGRGSAANSAVCFALGITSVDPIALELLFERFLSEDRQEAPDIDLDIEHERREKVLQYVYQRYGREHAGMVCTFITYHARSAVRDIGKALGLTEAQVRQATKVLDGQSGTQLAQALEEGALALPGLRVEDARMRHLVELARRIDGFPRHLSIHTGGMVVSASPLSEVVPIENATMPGRTVIQWDKDDVGQVGLVKIDLLGLGALALLHRARDLLREHAGLDLDLAHLPPNDTAVYDMLCRADTVGVFQVESRAQMNCLPRLKPRCFYDLVIEVALIRPGPIQGKMVHPFLRRRQGREAVTYAHPVLKPILARTLGVPLFQEQGMKIAVAAAGFTPSEADELRRAMGHRRSRQRMADLARRLIDGMGQRGIGQKAAERIFEQLAAFADFGFAESHAASFALLVYATAWIKHHHPAVYVAAILNAQPMGFYSPATLVNDARRHGVSFRPIDVQHSDYDCTLERVEEKEELAVRLGLRHVHGLGEELGARILVERHKAPFRSAEDFGLRCALSSRILERLARLGAFSAFGLERREALWQIQTAARHIPGPLAASRPEEPEVELPAMTAREEVGEDYRNAGLSISKQPMQLWREQLRARGALSADQVNQARHGQRVTIGGLVICRQRPPTAGGMCFLTLEDETGLANIVVTPPIFARYRREVRLAPFLLVRGRVETVEGVTNIKGETFQELRSASLEGRFESHDFR